ncbi:tetratricopeptide repeat protein [Natronoglycomyces albus]|uniref:Tetratricopeptide repeat protein n=1 Tax=Natronoglycomyces albus TaxID=2811108 RepID=A0A895XMK2_9ACTN|nr:hypothetical protein [Natronoglycomyces albus]QSB04992.1 hypothetical protein JQS30_14690 [Natronoglycomyces albus]
MTDDDFTGLTIPERLERAELMYDLGQLPDAKHEVEAALHIDPFHTDANAMKAVVELADGDADNALASAGTALQLDPYHSRAMITRGYALAALKRRDEAMQAAANILDTDHSSWLYQVHYALITRQVKNGQHTIDAAWNAVHLAPDEPRAHLALAVVAADLGLDDLSKRALAAAQRLDPEAITKVEDLAEGRTISSRGAVSADGTAQSADDVAESSSGKRLGKGVARFYGNALGTGQGAAHDPRQERRPAGRHNLFTGPMLPPILLGIGSIFGVVFLFSLVGPDELTGGRIFMGVIAAAALIGWYFKREPQSGDSSER